MPFFATISVLIGIFLSALLSPLCGQNLVPNPLFDEFVYCPVGINQTELEILHHWKQTTRGTPDYYHTCGNEMGVPNNVFGYREPAAGEGYLGLVAFSPSRRNYREYMHAQLSSPLRKGEWYCVSMKVALAQNATYISDGIGAALTPLPFPRTRNMDIQYPAELNNPPGNLLYYQEDWVTISAPYLATGGEQYITVGNFRADEDLLVKNRLVDVKKGKLVHHAYYFIDDVQVVLVSGPTECDDTVYEMAAAVEAEAAADPPEDRNYRTVRLQSVLFDFDEDVITTESREQLNEVVRVLKRNPYYEIEVVGHADIIGTEEYNIGLSRRRSEQVIAFLYDRGIAKNRLRIRYFGSAQPVTTNETEEGRQQNRRVEFLILEKQYEEFTR